MMNNNVKRIIEISNAHGWVLETDSKKLLSEYDLPVTTYGFATNYDECLNFVEKNGFPVVCKVVSPDIVHKSDVGGVVVGIDNNEELLRTFEKFKQLKGFQGVLIEKMVSGLELIIGASNDEQFGPVVLVGLGGVSVEIYKDTSMGMAPLSDSDIDEMLHSLKCYKLLEGYRGSKGINIKKLKEVLLKFSYMVMDLKDYFESIDLNPVICNENQCIIADARIILR